MKRSTGIGIGAVVVAAIVILVVPGSSGSKPEPRLFSSQSTSTVALPAAPISTPSFIGPTLGSELIPVADARRKKQAMVSGIPLQTHCADYLGETYFARIPRVDHPNARSKLDIDGSILMVVRLRDGSLQIRYDDVATGFILGDDFAFAPDGPHGTFWINPESFGPIDESKIGVCVRRR